MTPHPASKKKIHLWKICRFFLNYKTSKKFHFFFFSSEEKKNLSRLSNFIHKSQLSVEKCDFYTMSQLNAWFLLMFFFLSYFSSADFCGYPTNFLLGTKSDSQKNPFADAWDVFVKRLLFILFSPFISTFYLFFSFVCPCSLRDKKIGNSNFRFLSRIKLPLAHVPSFVSSLIPLWNVRWRKFNRAEINAEIPQNSFMSGTEFERGFCEWNWQFHFAQTRLGANQVNEY